MNWIVGNKDWIFSGIGVAVLTFVISLIGYCVKKMKHTSQSITSGDNSNNVQGGNDVNVTIGDKNARR
ncbi:hypothetical protein [Desulfosporosinus lacus]|uniref:Uncharacterized protein n=1 Tax=Desulfosporosinus lacus DSM 15449 TaxID=1121420 RepID=A0A1M5QGF2_9FIRM|nr:hypothetical protein [Desulfosporosinus lacus]SHH12920.1 hypothetical protein SAMN02746098_00246 [Desulfosporosinus lacus DSM 15449]